MKLLKAWASFKSTNSLHMLPEDVSVLDKLKKQRTDFKSWEEYINDPNFGAPKDTKLHLGLIPQPFTGNLKTASIFILQLNPGIGPSDYYGEYKIPKFKRALLDNLKQKPLDYPYIFLNPQFSWHGGYKYWHSKLNGVIENLRSYWNYRSYAKAQRRLAGQLATIELVPYHSSSFSEKGGLLKLESVTLMKNYLNEVLIPKAKKGKAIIISTRNATWRLRSEINVIVYPPGHAQGAHLTPDSYGGKAILDFLKCKKTV